MILSGGALGVMSVVMSTAVLPYQEPEQSAKWLCEAFGFSTNHVAKDSKGEIQYISLKLGRNFVLINPAGGPVFADLLVEPDSVGKRATQTCYVNVADIELHFAQAKLSGAEIALEPETDSDGSSFYMCRDPEGHLWIFGTRQYAAEPELDNLEEPKKPSAKEQVNKGKPAEQVEPKPVEALELSAIKPIELLAAEPQKEERFGRRYAVFGMVAFSLILISAVAISFLGGSIENTSNAISVAFGGDSKGARKAKNLLDAERQQRKVTEHELLQANARLSTANDELVRLRGRIEASQQLILNTRTRERAAQKIERANILTELVLKQRLLEANQKAADISDREERGLEAQKEIQERLAKAQSDLASVTQNLESVRKERDQLKQQLADAGDDIQRRNVARSEAPRGPVSRESTVAELTEQLRSRELAGATPDRSLDQSEGGQVASYAYPPKRVLDTPCKRAAWSRIFAAQEGTVGWRLRNTMRLCWRAQFSTAPVKCVELISGSGSRRSEGYPKLEIEDAVELCGGTHNARKPIQCFVRRRASNQSFNFAINRCQEFG